MMDVNNFENYTKAEYSANLLRLSIVNHSDLVGKEVYYSRPSYGVHRVEKWDANKCEYLLNLDGQKFWSSPFLIHHCG